jgi:hypothetical protein|tara:strand:- start:203 stop:439 length:237 start_codon:yes stop_codon:yes gene_type:complete
MDSKQKVEYENRDYADCNIRLNITIDIEAYPELKNILTSEKAKNFIAESYLGALNNQSEAEVLRSFSVEQIEGSKFDK